MKQFTGARPVRYLRGSGWVQCEWHQAQRWQPVLADRVLGTAPWNRSKQDAIRLIEANILSKAPLPRQYEFGKRMPARPENVGVIASATDVIMSRAKGCR